MTPPHDRDHEHDRAECRKIFEQLSEYLDDELPAGPCERIVAHLDDCAPCREFLDSLRRTIGLVRDLPSRPLPERVRRDVLDAYRKLRDSGSV